MGRDQQARANSLFRTHAIGFLNFIWMACAWTPPKRFLTKAVLMCWGSSPLALGWRQTASPLCSWLKMRIMTGGAVCPSEKAALEWTPLGAMIFITVLAWRSPGKMKRTWRLTAD